MRKRRATKQPEALGDTITDPLLNERHLSRCDYPGRRFARHLPSLRCALLDGTFWSEGMQELRILQSSAEMAIFLFRAGEA
jgi:hypothetical protein